MIKQAYIDTINWFKPVLKVIFGILFVLLIVAIPSIPIFWLITTYFNNLFCFILGGIADFVLIVFIFNLLFIWVDSKRGVK